MRIRLIYATFGFSFWAKYRSVDVLFSLNKSDFTSLYPTGPKIKASNGDSGVSALPSVKK